MARGILSNKGKVELVTGGSNIIQSEVTNQTGTTITFNDYYTFGESGALFYRNGVLMDKVSSFTSSGTTNAEEYIEVNNGSESNQILLNSTNPATSDELFQMVFVDNVRLYDSGTSTEIKQIAHGFSVGQGIYHNGSEWVLGIADNEDKLATYVVAKILTPDRFVAYQFGRSHSPAHGFTVGKYYFLSDATAGTPIDSPSTTGYSCPLFYVEDPDYLQIMVYRPAAPANDVNLTDLADVSATSPEDGQALVYNENNGQWESKTPASAGGSSIYYMYNLDGFGKASEAIASGDAVVSEETAAPLHGKKTLKITYGTNPSAGDGAAIPGISAQERSKKAPVHKVSFICKYNGPKDKVYITVTGGYPSTELFTLYLDPDRLKYSAIFTHKLDTFGVQSFRIKAVDNSAANAEILIDDIEFSDKAYEYGQETITENVYFYAFSQRVNTDRVEFSNVNANNSGNLIEAKSSTYYGSYIVVKKNCFIEATLSAAIAVNTYIIVATTSSEYIAPRQVQSPIYENGDYNDNVTLNGYFKKGDIIYARAGADMSGESYRQWFSITATAQSDTVVFEDTREQAHTKGYVEWKNPNNYYKGWYRTDSGYLDASTADTDTVKNASGGDVEFLSDMAAGFRIKNMKKGTYTLLMDKLSIRSLSTGSSGATIYLKDSVGGTVTRTATFYVNDDSSLPVITMTFKLDEDKDALDLFFYVSVISVDVTDFWFSLNYRGGVTVLYTPPNEQKNVPMTLQLPVSKENDFGVRAKYDGTELSDFYGASDWCTYTRISDGEYEYTLNTAYFTVFPDIDATGYGSTGADTSIYLRTFPKFSVYTSSNGTLADKWHRVRAFKTGADRTPPQAYVIGDERVAKEQVMTFRLTGDGGTTKPGQTLEINNVEGDSFASVDYNTDTITLPKGKYAIDASCTAYHTGYHEMYCIDHATSNEIGNYAHGYAADADNVATPIFLREVITVETTLTIEFTAWKELSGGIFSSYTAKSFIRKLA